MGLKPKSSWPKSLHQRHYTCALCGGVLVQTCELQFDTGFVAPTIGDMLIGMTSGATGVVIGVTLESGVCENGTAAGTVYLSSPTGVTEDGACFVDGETVNVN